MAIATTNQTVLRSVAEVTWGTTPTNPTMVPQRYVSHDIKHVKTTRMSESMRADRQRLYNFETGQDVAGTVNFELAPDQLFESAFLAGAMCCTPVAVNQNLIGSTVFATAGNMITCATATFATWGLVAGMWVKVTGSNYAANNVSWRINTVAETVLTVDDPDNTMVNDTADISISAWTCTSGTTLKSWTLEKDFDDLTTTYLSYTGCRVNEWNLRATAREIIQSSFGLVGKTTGTGVTIGAGSRSETYSAISPVTASVNVAEIQEGGNVSYASKSLIGVGVREFTLNVNNNLRGLPQVSAKTPYGIEPGWHDVTGTLVAYFEDSTLVGKILNHTATMLRLHMVDSSGIGIIVTLPEVYYTGDTPAAGGGNQDVVVPLSFVALRDSSAAYTIQVDVLREAYS